MVKASSAAASPIGDDAKRKHREDGQDEAEGQRFRPRDPARRDRPLGGAPHDGVDIGVVPHVERARGARADGDGE